MPNIPYEDLPLTSFPVTPDTFVSFLNVTAQDGPLVLQYLDAMNTGNITLATQILAQIPSASQKIIRATDLNHMTQAILAIERFYQTDIEPYIDEKQQEWTNIINRFSYIGTWNSGTSYVQNNMVTYNAGGVTLLYIATAANVPVGTPPTNSTYWRVASVVGLQGESGPGLTFSRAWDSSTVYPENSAVVYGGALWYALQENTNVQPGTDSEIWVNFLDLSTTVYPIQDTEPVSAVQGGLWFNTQNNPTGYVHLDPLDNPAQANQILSTYEAYNDQGEVIEGTLDVYTKPEIDEKLADYLPLAGGTMTGAIAMSNQKITGLGAPTEDNDAVRKIDLDNVPTGAVIETLQIAAGNTISPGDVVDINSSNQVYKNVTAEANVKSNPRNNSFNQGDNIVLTSNTEGVWFNFNVSQSPSSGYEDVTILGYRINIASDTTITSIVGNAFQVYSATPARNVKATPSVRLDSNRVLVSYSVGRLFSKIITLQSNNNVTIGTQYTINDTSLGNAVTLISDDSVLFVYIDNGLKGKVCTISDSTMTIGTEYANSSFTNNNIGDLTTVVLPDDDSGNHRVLVCLSDESDSSKGKAVVATINSINEITWGSTITFAPQATSTVAINHVTAQYLNQFIYIIYRQNEGIWCTKIPLNTLQPESPTLLVAISGTQLDVTSCVVNDQLLITYLNTNGITSVVNTTNLTLSNPYTFNSGAVNNLIAVPYNNNQFLVAYADDNNNDHITTTILEVSGNQIAGSFTQNSSTAIALGSGVEGQNVQIIYSGITQADWIVRDQIINSPGVYGVGVTNGVLQVYGKNRPGQVFGSFVGTGSEQSINLGFRPKAVIVATSNGSEGGPILFVYPQTSCNYNPSSSERASIAWNDTGFSMGKYAEDYRTNGRTYYYIAFM